MVAGLLWGLQPGILRDKGVPFDRTGEIHLSVRNASLDKQYRCGWSLGYFPSVGITWPESSDCPATLGQSVGITLDEFPPSFWPLLGLALAVLLALWFGGQDVIRHWVLAFGSLENEPNGLSVFCAAVWTMPTDALC